MVAPARWWLWWRWWWWLLLFVFSLCVFTLPAVHSILNICTAIYVLYIHLSLAVCVYSSPLTLSLPQYTNPIIVRYPTLFGLFVSRFSLFVCGGRLTILYADALWCAFEFDWHFTSMFIKFYFVNVCLTLLYHLLASTIRDEHIRVTAPGPTPFTKFIANEENRIGLAGAFLCNCRKLF